MDAAREFAMRSRSARRRCWHLIPGSSRSGSTIMGGLFAGLTRETAARFSFLLSIPAIAASGLLELKEAVDEVAGRELRIAGRRDGGFGGGGLCVDLVSVAISADAFDECFHCLSRDCRDCDPGGVVVGVYVGKYLEPRIDAILTKDQRG